MATTSLTDESFGIPFPIAGLPEFRRWVHSPEFPEHARVDYVCGRIEVDRSPEDVYCHAKLKTKLIISLGPLIEAETLGELFHDRMRVTCPAVQLSVEPDVLFVAYDALRSGRVRLVPKSGGAPGRYVELEGPPNLIVEIVSDSSEIKDCQRLREAYFAAGVDEYWLIDARGAELSFQLLQRAATQYKPAAADAEGYCASRVFQRRFQLLRERDELGHWRYDLKVRP